VSIVRPLTIASLVLVVLALAPAAPRAQGANDIFNGQVLHRVDLLMHSADWAKLKENFQTNEYYPADFSWSGQVARNSGIRSRGLGSRSGTKPGLRVDFDRYATDQQFLGLKSLILDNLTQDASGIHETVAMALFARLGIPAPREAHARLYVNNEYVGLYAIVESVDKDLLARVFGVLDDDTQNDGYLFEFNYLDEWRFGYLGGDLEPYKARFDATTNESKSDEEKYRPIETLVRLVNETAPDRLTDAIGGLLDIPAFIRFVAAQNFVAENDGFVGNWGMNNFYFYRLENRSDHVLIAWDADNAFWGPTFATTTRLDDNVLMRKLMDVSEYRNLYFTELEGAAETAEEPAGEVSWLESEIRRQLDLIDRAMREDPVRPFTVDEFETAASAMTQFAGPRIRFVRCEIERGPGGGC
jgi:spore coat protein CotH